MDIKRYLDAADERRVQQAKAAQAALDAESTRLKLNGERVVQALKDQALPVFIDAGTQLLERGYSAEVSTIKSELHSPVGLPLVLTLSLKLSNDPKVEPRLCSLTYRGECMSAMITAEFKTPFAQPEEPVIPLQSFTKATVEAHVEKLVKWSLSL